MKTSNGCIYTYKTSFIRSNKLWERREQKQIYLPCWRFWCTWWLTWFVCTTGNICCLYDRITIVLKISIALSKLLHLELLLKLVYGLMVFDMGCEFRKPGFNSQQVPEITWCWPWASQLYHGWPPSRLAIYVFDEVSVKLVYIQKHYYTYILNT